jgi:hypothetical protein
MASQQSPAKDINELSIDDIAESMRTQFDPTRYIVRERFKFWSDMKRRPGESILELAARIRQDAVTCDFVSIKDPLDEAMRTRFMCFVNNEAVLKALFKVKDAELTFAKAIAVEVETEDAAKVAKETVYGSSSKQVVVCLQKRKDSHTVKVITKRKLWSVKRINSVPQLQQDIQISGQQFSFEVDTGAGDNFCSIDVWTKLGKPALTPTTR